MLTRKQKDLLTLIRDCVQQEGVPPSFDEMKIALGLKSKSGIHRLITGLEERGYIRRLAHRARAIEITRLPDGMALPVTPSSPPLRRTQPTIAPPTTMPSARDTNLSLPLYGRIAAGTPIEALRDPHQFLDIPTSLITRNRTSIRPADHYILEVEGQSMIDDGIMDGDYVIIQKCDTAENRTIVVALVDEHEATLKHIERRGDMLALIPANTHYETRLLPAHRVRIQGRLVGLIRRY